MTRRTLSKCRLRPAVVAGLLICSTMGLGGCMHNPYVNRTILYEDGTETKKFFAYGNYCGPEHPGPEVDMTAPPEPMDDLDEACRLHDKCHRSPRSDLDMCDLGLSEWIIGVCEIATNIQDQSAFGRKALGPKAL